MRWLRRKKTVNPERGEAVKAVREAQTRLNDTQAQWPEVQALSRRLAYIRERNHLAEAIRAAIDGGE